MRKKSKFITFILSFVPGISHFYLGYGDRGIIYLIIFGMLGVGSIVLSAMLYSRGPMVIGIGAVCVLWLISLMDAFSVLNILNEENNLNIKENWNSEKTKVSNKKVITLALSIVPGAGHMYLGYQKKGLVLMGGFFFTIFFMGWLNSSFLLFLLPLIWFYSFFDALHELNGSHVEEVDIFNILPSIKQEHIGIGLIGLGIIIILQKVLVPVAEQILYSIFERHIIYQLRNYIQTVIVSLIFILGGIKMIRNKKDSKYTELEAIKEDEK